MKSLKFITVLMALTICVSAFGQSLNSFNYKMKLAPTGDVLNKVDTVYAYQCDVDLKKLENITKLHFKMGTTKGGDEKFSYSFNYGQTDNLPEGVAYRQTDEVVTLTPGNFIAEAYWYEVKLEDGEGNMSTAKQKQY